MKDKVRELSIVDKGLSVEGELYADGKLVIAGRVTGTLVGNAVVAAEGSMVAAEAKVGDLVIAGVFQGDVTAYESLHISPTGIFTGNVICKNLRLEAGGILNGSVRPLADMDGQLPLPNKKAPAAGK
jgi:cytoskeletal protein CcmA (bactofilin family)